MGARSELINKRHESVMAHMRRTFLVVTAKREKTVRGGGAVSGIKTGTLVPAKY